MAVDPADKSTVGLDFETDAGADGPTEGELSRIAALVADLRERQRAVAEQEAALKEAKEAARKLEEQDIPVAMDEVGMAELRLADGTRVSVERGVRASIPKKHQSAAFAWLEANGYADLIKTELNARAGRGELEQMRAAAQELQRDFGLSPELKESVHPQTLQAWVRERRAEGDDIPDDLFGVFEYRKTKLRESD